MKALVLAGGTGSRLRPMTHSSAKQLLPLANRPVLFHVLDTIADAGLTEVGIVVGGTGDQIRAAVGDGSRFGLKVTYLCQERPLGLAHAVMVAADFLDGEPFLLYLGDNYLSCGIGKQVRGFEEDTSVSRLLAAQVSRPERFGLVHLGEDGRVMSVQEKPARPTTDLALVGVYLLSARIHCAVTRIAPSARGELEITDAIRLMLEEGDHFEVSRVTGAWKDTGDVEDILDANRMAVAEVPTVIRGDVDESSRIIGPVSLGEGAVVRRSRIVGPAVVGANTRITDSYVGPFTSIASGAELEQTGIEDSVILERAAIRGVRNVRRSLVGRGARVNMIPVSPSGHRMVVGDQSEVELGA